MPNRQSRRQRSVSVGVTQLAWRRVDRRRPSRSQSKERQPLTIARAETRQEFRRLVAYLRALRASAQLDLAGVATAALQRLPRNADRLDARTFDRVLYAIRNHRDALPMPDRGAWLVVECLTTTLFQALLRQFRVEVTQRPGTV